MVFTTSDDMESGVYGEHLNVSYNIGSFCVFTASFETGGVYLSNSVLHSLYFVAPERKKRLFKNTHIICMPVCPHDLNGGLNISAY